jgi:hypothetical protein
MPPTLTPEQQARIDAIPRTPITMMPVESSQIAAIGHDPNTSTLAIRFQPKAGFEQGSLYHYANASAEFFARFREAETIGGFFYQNIKKKSDELPYVQVEPDSNPAEQQAA